MSSIQSLPNELLVAIFITATTEPSRNYGDIPIPCIISSVCSHWRDVALNLPTIWTNITISDMKPLNLPTLCMKRSRGKPLQLFLSISNPGASYCDVIAFLLYNERIRHLTLTMYYSGGVATHPRLYTIVKNFARHLEYVDLNISGPPPSAFQHYDAAIMAFLFATSELRSPRLRSIRVNGTMRYLRFFLQEPPMPLPISSLTSLHIRFSDFCHPKPQFPHDSWDNFNSFLSGYMNLQELVIDGLVHPLPSGTDRADVVTFASLRSLAIRWPNKTTCRELLNFFHRITAPHLAYLELVGVSGSVLDEITLESTHKLFPELLTLRLGLCDSHLVVFSPEFHQFFSSVRELQLVRSDCHYLLPAQEPPDTRYWPALEVVSYDGGNISWLQDVVQSRYMQGVPLRLLHLRSGKFTHSHIASLKRLVDVQCVDSTDIGFLRVSPIEDLKDTPDGECLEQWIDDVTMLG